MHAEKKSLLSLNKVFSGPRQRIVRVITAAMTPSLICSKRDSKNCKAHAGLFVSAQMCRGCVVYGVPCVQTLFYFCHGNEKKLVRYRPDYDSRSPLNVAAVEQRSSLH